MYSENKSENNASKKFKIRTTFLRIIFIYQIYW